jgi:hypothetical protein
VGAQNLPLDVAQQQADAKQRYLAALIAADVEMQKQGSQWLLHLVTFLRTLARAYLPAMPTDSASFFAYATATGIAYANECKAGMRTRTDSVTAPMTLAAFEALESSSRVAVCAFFTTCLAHSLLKHSPLSSKEVLATAAIYDLPMTVYLLNVLFPMTVGFHVALHLRLVVVTEGFVKLLELISEQYRSATDSASAGAFLPTEGNLAVAVQAITDGVKELDELTAN